MERDLTIDEILALNADKPKEWEPGQYKRALNKKICPKCHGLGKIAIYSHVKKGKCFECNGQGFWYTE